jgi:hypothetical protein
MDVATEVPNNTPDTESGAKCPVKTPQSETMLQFQRHSVAFPLEHEVSIPCFDASQTPQLHNNIPLRALAPVLPSNRLFLPPRHRRCFDWRMADSDVDFAKNRSWFKSYKRLYNPNKANGIGPMLIGDTDTGFHEVHGIGTVEIRVLRGPYVYGTTIVRMKNVLHMPSMVCNGFNLDRLIHAVGGVRAEFSPPKCLVYGDGGAGGMEEGEDDEHSGGDKLLVFLKKDAVLIYKLMLPRMFPWSEFEATANPGDMKCLSFVLDPNQRAWFENLRR